jgi:hypothetical protein
MSDYYSIKSKLNGNVVDIEQGNSTAGLKDGQPLDAYPQKTEPSGPIPQFQCLNSAHTRGTRGSNVAPMHR